LVCDLRKKPDKLDEEIKNHQACYCICVNKRLSMWRVVLKSTVHCGKMIKCFEEKARKQRVESREYLQKHISE